MKLTVAQIHLEERSCTQIFEQYFASVSTKNRGLKLPSLELAEWLATQITIPILTGLVSSFLWERFKNIRSKKHAEEAREALSSEPVPEQPAVSEETVIEYLAIKLTESVVESDARTIVTEEYRRLRLKTSR